MDSKHTNGSLKFQSHHDDFKELLGPSPQLDLLLENSDYPFAHEAGVYIDSTNELFITSNRFQDVSGDKKIQISKIHLNDEPVRQEEIHCGKILMGNGGVNYQDGILFCEQGTGSTPSGLFKMSATAPYTTSAVLTSFYGRPFNSVNDVVIAQDGCIWFTDPIYGFDQGYRPRPQLPCQVYRYDPKTFSIRAVADGFGRPNGICFSPDEKVVYITDTDYIHGDGSRDGLRASTMWV